MNFTNIPTWAKWVTSVGGAIAIVYAAAVWSADTIDKAIVSESELAEVLRSQRIQKNQEKLIEYNRDIVAERFSNEAEKQLVVKEIERLQKELKCDTENKCDVP